MILNAVNVNFRFATTQATEDLLVEILVNGKLKHRYGALISVHEVLLEGNEFHFLE